MSRFSTPEVSCDQAVVKFAISGANVHDCSRVRQRPCHTIGVALWREDDGDAELVAIVTTYRGAGAGVALLDAVVAHARASGWHRLWLITTNDNTDALRLYQRAGWEWVAWHRDAVSDSRRLKPELPEKGAHGITIRHEIELEYPL